MIRLEVVALSLLLMLLLGGPRSAHADEGAARSHDPKRTEAALLKALASRDYQVRRKAVLAVKGRDEPALFERVLRMALRDTHPNIRGYTADVLSTFEDPRVFDALATLAQDLSPGPRQSAFVGLGRYGDARGYAILIKTLGAGRGLRGYAAKGLGLLGDARAFEPVETAYRAHPDDPYLNEMAPAALVALDRERGLATCRACFLNLPAVARPGLVRELGRHPSDATRELMLAQLRSATEAGLRHGAIQVLVELADPKSAEGLLAAFQDQPDHRVPIAKALGRLREPRAVRPLVDALGAQTGGPARHIFMEALGRIGDPRAVHALIPLLDDLAFVAQPRQISSISGFPSNVWTRGVALWSIRLILDEAEPFALGTLLTFPKRAPSQQVVDGIARLKIWWSAHQHDARYRLTDR